MEAKVEIVDVPHGEIEPNPSNPNEMNDAVMKALREDIEKRGFVQPVLVRPIGLVAGEIKMHVKECPMTSTVAEKRYTCTCQHYDNDERTTPERGIKYRIIDGEHRWRVLGELGAETVPCVVENSSEADAQIRMITMNRIRGSFVPVKLAHLLADLAERTDRKEIQARLAMPSNELKDLLDLGDYLEPPNPKVDSPGGDPLPPGRNVAIVATPEQAQKIYSLIGEDPEDQADSIAVAVRDA